MRANTISFTVFPKIVPSIGNSFINTMKNINHTRISIHFFFLKIRRPTRSTLFPYPTLFRSSRSHASGSRGGAPYTRSLVISHMSAWPDTSHVKITSSSSCAIAPRRSLSRSTTFDRRDPPARPATASRAYGWSSRSSRSRNLTSRSAGSASPSGNGPVQRSSEHPHAGLGREPRLPLPHGVPDIVLDRADQPRAVAARDPDLVGGGDEGPELLVGEPGDVGPLSGEGVSLRRRLRQYAQQTLGQRGIPTGHEQCLPREQWGKMVTGRADSVRCRAVSARGPVSHSFMPPLAPGAPAPARRERQYEPAEPSRGRQDRHGIARDAGVARQECEALVLRLRHQHTVERIVMVTRQRTGDGGVLELDRQPPDPALVERSQQVLRRLQLSERPLDRDLPRTRGAGEHLGLVRDQEPRLLRQRRIVGQPPQQDVGVEQKPHDPSPRNAAAIPDGSSSKSSWMTTRPRQRPGSRGMTARGIGPSRAIGRPALLMMISSPAAARSTRRDRCVFAS